MASDDLRYSSGEEIRLGDSVLASGTAPGTVVCVIERGEFTPDFPAAQWAYLERGFMVLEADGTLIHYEHPISDLRFLSRASGPAHA
jgi:hypothetical protein